MFGTYGTSVHIAEGMGIAQLVQGLNRRTVSTLEFTVHATITPYVWQTIARPLLP